ncbi:hypothetical protein H8356DRAFT_923687, partial [Neocallimastix lanati (nom. inval.)]
IILEFKQQISSWYSYNFNFLKLLIRIKTISILMFCKFIASLNNMELVKVKTGFVYYESLAPDDLEKAIKGYLLFYEFNPPCTSVKDIGSFIADIKHYKILDIMMI